MQKRDMEQQQKDKPQFRPMSDAEHNFINQIKTIREAFVNLEIVYEDWDEGKYVPIRSSIQDVIIKIGEYKAERNHCEGFELSFQALAQTLAIANVVNTELDKLAFVMNQVLDDAYRRHTNKGKTKKSDNSGIDKKQQD